MNAIQGARVRGAAEIDAFDVSPERIERARRFGATGGVDARDEGELVLLRQRAPRHGYDWTIVTVGRPDAVQLGVELTRPGGTTVVVGLLPESTPVALDMLDLVTYEKKVVGSAYGSTSPQTLMPRILRLYLAGKLALDELVWTGCRSRRSTRHLRARAAPTACGPCSHSRTAGSSHECRMPHCEGRGDRAACTVLRRRRHRLLERERRRHPDRRGRAAGDRRGRRGRNRRPRARAHGRRACLEPRPGLGADRTRPLRHRRAPRRAVRVHHLARAAGARHARALGGRRRPARSRRQAARPPRRRPARRRGARGAAVRDDLPGDTGRADARPDDGCDGRAVRARPRARLSSREDGGDLGRSRHRPRARGVHPAGSRAPRRRRHASRRLRLPLDRSARRAVGALAPRGRGPLPRRGGVEPRRPRRPSQAGRASGDEGGRSGDGRRRARVPRVDTRGCGRRAAAGRRTLWWAHGASPHRGDGGARGSPRPPARMEDGNHCRCRLPLPGSDGQFPVLRAAPPGPVRLAVAARPHAARARAPRRLHHRSGRAGARDRPRP